MEANNQTSVERRGGYRANAGRPVGSKDAGPRMTKERFAQRLARLQSLGVLQGTARRVLEAIGGDGYWLDVIGKLEDEGNTEKIAALMQFLLQMRDGRPAQQINVTSLGVTFNASEMGRVKELVRELSPELRVGHANPQPPDAPPSAAKVAVQTIAAPRLALGEGRMDGEHASCKAREEKDGQ